MDLLKSIDSLNQEGILKSKSPKFIIAGTGPEEERLKKYELENNISNYVEFVGWIDGKEKKNFLNSIFLETYACCTELIAAIGTLNPITLKTGVIISLSYIFATIGAPRNMKK